MRCVKIIAFASQQSPKVQGEQNIFGCHMLKVMLGLFRQFSETPDFIEEFAENLILLEFLLVTDRY